MKKTLQGHTSSITCLTFSADNHWLVSGSEDRTLRVWDVKQDFACVKTLEEHKDEITCVAFSGNVRWMASTSWDKTIRIWNVENDFECIRALTDHKGWVYSVAFSPDSRLMATGSAALIGNNGPVMVWDVEDDFDLIATLTEHTFEVGSLDFSPDSRLLISGSGDGTNRIWDCANEFECTNVLSQTLIWGRVFGVAFSPNGKWVISTAHSTCEDGRVIVFNAKAPKPQTAFEKLF